MKALKITLLAIAMIAANYFVFAFVLQDLWWGRTMGDIGILERLTFILVLIIALGAFEMWDLI